VFCLLVVLVKLSVLAMLNEWLVRLPRKPNCGVGIVSTKPRPKNVYGFLSLVYCFILSLQCFDTHCWLGDRKGIRPVKNLVLVLLVVMI